MKDFELIQGETQKEARRDDLCVLVVGEDSKIFHRRAIKLLPDGGELRESMLVAQLGDVYAYLVDGQFVLTRGEIYL